MLEVGLPTILDHNHFEYLVQGIGCIRFRLDAAVFGKAVVSCDRDAGRRTAKATRSTTASGRVRRVDEFEPDPVKNSRISVLGSVQHDMADILASTAQCNDQVLLALGQIEGVDVRSDNSTERTAQVAQTGPRQHFCTLDEPLPPNHSVEADRCDDLIPTCQIAAVDMVLRRMDFDPEMT